MKIFLASNPSHQHNNLHGFYDKLSHDSRIELIHPLKESDIEEDFVGVIEHEIGRRNMLNIFKSDVLIFDYDTKPPVEWLAYSNTGSREVIVVSRAQVTLNPFISRNVRAVIKSEDTYSFINYLYSESSSDSKSQETSSDK